MPKPYPQEFREDVIRVARNREPGVRITDIATDFGISSSCLQNWLTRADRDDGVRPGPTSDELAGLREAKKRIRLPVLQPDRRLVHRLEDEGPARRRGGRDGRRPPRW